MFSLPFACGWGISCDSGAWEGTGSSRLFGACGICDGCESSESWSPCAACKTSEPCGFVTWDMSGALDDCPSCFVGATKMYFTYDNHSVFEMLANNALFNLIMFATRRKCLFRLYHRNIIGCKFWIVSHYIYLLATNLIAL